MANEDVMAVDERVANLEKTVAKGLLDVKEHLAAHTGRLDEHTGRFDRLEDRMAALDAKFDVVSESIRGDIKTVLEAITSLGAEMRRTTRSIRKEHEADRRITKSVLLDHLSRIRSLEGRGATRRKRREP
jgi:uncharacterized coiled-coil protein SlyX